MDNPEAPIQRWWNEETVAVVTGANKGIGDEVVRQLADHGIRGILTARDEERGKAAAKSLNDDGFHNVVFHQLDVQNGMSVQAFANWSKEHYGKLDILVNNAAILGLAIDYDILKANKTDPAEFFTSLGSSVEGVSETYEMAKECIDINYYGTKKMHIPSETLRQQLSNLHDSTELKMDAFLQNFLKDFQQGVLESKGWPASVKCSAYYISKAALNAYTRVIARQHPDMYVNCGHPGVIKTDMNFNTRWLSIDEGAKVPVMLALLPPDSPSGQYYDEEGISSFEVLGIKKFHRLK